jgi:MFS family permease
MVNTKSLKKLVLLGSLYVSQFIPFFFLYQALPVFMRQRGFSLQAISLLSFLIFPSVLNFLWSPLIDRYSFTTLGHYRFWVICFQILIACTTFAAGLINIGHNFTALIVCLFVVSIFSASQNIATDALAVKILDVSERGLGNGVQMGGNYLGAVIGGGGLLILLNDWGWTATMLTLTLLMVLALLPILRYKEPSRKIHAAPQTAPHNVPALMNLVKFFLRPKMWRWVLILALSMRGGMMATTMYRPLLVDIGLSLADIGWLLGVVSYSAGIVAALAAGFLMNPLGRKRSLIFFGLLDAIATATCLLPTFGLTNLPTLYLIAIAVQFAISMANTAICTIMMDKSELRTAGTDYTIQTSVVSFSTIVAAAISGIIAQSLGYRGVFVISAALSLIGVAIIAIAFDNTKSDRDLVLTPQ